MSGMPSRLSALDTSFLQVESPTAHMHVGWAAELKPDTDDTPSFEAVRDHIAARLTRAPRYRQRLMPVPFGLHDPLWVDDVAFDIERHVVRARAQTLEELAGQALSTPLARSRPLWEIWVAEEMGAGHLGIVGKAHHCLVDGVAAVELAALLLDPSPDAEVPSDDWRPQPAPGAGERFLGALGEITLDALTLGLAPVRAVLRPATMGAAPGTVSGAARALARALRPAPASPTLNPDSSSLRSLTTLSRPLAELAPLRRRYGMTVNDIVLAASAGALRATLARRGETPVPIKAMVPANVRTGDAAAQLGNRIAMLFVDLPCDEAEPEQRLRTVAAEMAACKQSADPAAGDALLGALRLLPRPLHAAVARRVASPRTANVVVSNIPGPPGELFLLGARLRRAYPVVPLSEEHALSIGVTSLGGELCFGLHADRLGLPETEHLREDLDRSLDELIALSRRPRSNGARRLHRAPA